MNEAGTSEQALADIKLPREDVKSRSDGRRADELRQVSLTIDAMQYAEGSVLIAMGATRVICTASLEERVPPFLRHTGRGWVTAEYAMLPRATHTRTQREVTRTGGVSGRTHEIQRLIGRSLRAVVDTTRLGERTVTIDCDVLQADGGTRTASITGAFVALALANRKLLKERKIARSILTGEVAAVSVGIVGGQSLLDLKYDEDSKAETDMNVVCTGGGKFIEVQGTAEQKSFSRAEMNELLNLAEKGIAELLQAQRHALIEQ